jgi:hypothetical protein
MDEFDGFLVELGSEDDLIDDARDAEREGPFAGEDPTGKHLAEQADRLTGWHCDDEHGGGPCTCQPARWSTTTEEPF